MTCPLCGFEFLRTDTLCHHGCPLGAACQMVRCPNCAYEFNERPPGGSWLARLLGRAPSRADCLPDLVRSAVELEPGERGTVVCAGSSTEHRSRSLTVFGLAPGAEIELIQQSPACVVKIGETELALDPEIAREILVRPADASDRSSHTAQS